MNKKPADSCPEQPSFETVAELFEAEEDEAEEDDELYTALVDENEEMKSDLRVMSKAFGLAIELVSMFKDSIPLTADERQRVDRFMENNAAHFPDHEAPERTGRNAPEPMPPTNSAYDAAWDLFFKWYEYERPLTRRLSSDIRERDAAGEAKYGTRLRVHNGRDARVDAYQEVLDGIVYFTQWAHEQPNAVDRNRIMYQFTRKLVSIAEDLIHEIERHPHEKA